MSKITPVLLNDTLNLIQLARETARIQGQKAQAERLTPVVDNLRTLVTEAREAKSSSQTADILNQKDFKTLLAAAQSTPHVPSQPFSSSTGRIQIVQAMSAGGMTDIDIARQMGMTREEVQLITGSRQPTNVTATGQFNKSPEEVSQ